MAERLYSIVTSQGEWTCRVLPVWVLGTLSYTCSIIPPVHFPGDAVLLLNMSYDADIDRLCFNNDAPRPSYDISELEYMLGTAIHSGNL